MAYTKSTWVDPQGSFLNRFIKQNETDVSVELIPNPVITNQPTPFSVEGMNKLEQGVYDAHEKDQNGARFLSADGGVGNGKYVENFTLCDTESLIGYAGALPVQSFINDNSPMHKIGLMGRCYISRRAAQAISISSIVDIILTRAYTNKNFYRAVLGSYDLNVGVIRVLQTNWIALLFPPAASVNISFTGCIFGGWSPQPIISPDSYTVITQAA